MTQNTNKNDTYLNTLSEALDDILNANSLAQAKEIAADALEVDVEEYLVQDVVEGMDDVFVDILDDEDNEDKVFKENFSKWDE